jgi:hypothetical protein
MPWIKSSPFFRLGERVSSNSVGAEQLSTRVDVPRKQACGRRRGLCHALFSRPRFVTSTATSHEKRVTEQQPFSTGRRASGAWWCNHLQVPKGGHKLVMAYELVAWISLSCALPNKQPFCNMCCHPGTSMHLSSGLFRIMFYFTTWEISSSNLCSFRNLG